MAGYRFPLRRGACTLFSLFLLSCAAPQPSDVPLGRGPLAGIEEPAANTEAPKPPVPTPSPPVDAVEQTVSADSESDDEEPVEEDDSESKEESENPAAALNGDYTGTDTTLFRMDGAPERSQEDPSAKTRVRVGKEGRIKFTLVDSSDGHDICTLSGHLTGMTATIDSGQECFSQGNESASTRGVVRGGKATLQDGQLELELELDFEIVAGGTVNEGKLIYHFEGKRE